MKTAPPVNLLDRIVSADRDLDMPLHAQVRRALKTLIDQHFEDGQRFWTETALAGHLNVSQITVRRALGDLAREGVLERKVSLGSIVRKAPPVEAAFSTLGVFIPEWHSPSIGIALDGFERLCQEQGRKMRVYHTRKGERTAQAFAKVNSSPDEQRFVIYDSAPEVCLELSTALSQRGYKHVMINASHPDVDAPYIGIDEWHAMREAFVHLTALGHTRIALMINEPENATGSVRRRMAFEACAENLGLTGCAIVNCHTKHFESSYDAVLTHMDELWNLKPRPTATIFVSDYGTFAAIKWCMHRDISLPREMSIMGFDNDLASRFVVPSVTTMENMAAVHARMAMEILEAGPAPGMVRLSKPGIVVRESTTVPPRE